MYFASGQKPRWVRYPFFDVDTTSGVVDEVTILTRGPEAQDLVLLEITEKFGPPTTKSIEHEQNGFGAKFDVINAVWKRADGVIDFISIVDPETGVITIKSKAFLAREQQEINAGAHL